MVNKPLVRNPQAIIELATLLQEAVRVDLRVGLFITYRLVELGTIPEKILSWSFLFEQIDQARQGSNAAREWCNNAINAALEIHYYPPPLMAYELEIRKQQRKPKERPYSERDRLIAQEIYKSRVVTATIPRHEHYTDSAQIDAIEKADNQGFSPFIEEFDPTAHPPYIELDTTTLRRIYQRHRRSLISSYAKLILYVLPI